MKSKKKPKFVVIKGVKYRVKVSYAKKNTKVKLVHGKKK